MIITPGIVAFFVVIAILLAAYAFVSPVNASARASVAPAPLSAGAKRSLFDRYIRPVVGNLLPQTPTSLTEYAQKNEGISAMLARTGNPWRVNAEEYVVVRILAVAAGALILMVLVVLGYAPVPLYIAVPIGAFIGFIAPKSLLDSAWAKRRRDLNAVLPEALDMLRICMNAGYNFQNGLEQTVNLLAPSITRDELSRVVAELRAGRTVPAALATFARRAPTDSVDAFSRAISQAQATGVDIATTLAYQADEARAEYERQVEVRSQKLQTTLFLPLIGFFLPVLLLLLFGPAVVTLLGAL